MEDLERRGQSLLSRIFGVALTISKVDGLRQLLNQPSDDEDEEDVSSPDSSAQIPKNMFVFQSGSSTSDLRWLHPISAQITLLCDTYFVRVDPIIKVLHRPTVKAQIVTAASNLGSVSRTSQEALMFSMYYAAVTSLSPDECQAQLGKDREIMLLQFKHATEAALVNVDFLSNPDLVALQAFVIFLASVRSNSAERSSWSLLGLAVRLAHALEIHRDGEGLLYTPFEAEMRRRLWAGIMVLDIHGVEDRGHDALILWDSYNTVSPRNINDEDISPTTTQQPEEKVGLTDIGFFLMMSDVDRLGQRGVLFESPRRKEAMGAMNDQQKGALITEGVELLKNKYLAHCEPSYPLFWLCSTLAKVMIAKAWLLEQYPLHAPRRPRRVNKEEVLNLATEILELTDDMDENPHAVAWAWWTSTWIQWQPIAFVLCQLCSLTTGPAVDRAWAIIDKTFKKASDRVAEGRRGKLWRPIKKLYQKALESRRQAIQEQDNKMKLSTNPDIDTSSVPGAIGTASADATTVNTKRLSDIKLGEAPTFAPFDTVNPQAIAGTYGDDALPNMDHEMGDIDWNEWDKFLQAAGDPTAEIDDMPWTDPIGLQ